MTPDEVYQARGAVIDLASFLAAEGWPPGDVSMDLVARQNIALPPGLRATAPREMMIVSEGMAADHSHLEVTGAVLVTTVSREPVILMHWYEGDELVLSVFTPGMMAWS